ncbi:MAG: sulfurtransferase TusA family protein [Rhodospirillales bacterium]
MANILDTSGLNCPLPVLKAKKALKGLAEGDSLTVIATDPSSVKDFEAFCQQTGDDLLDSKAEDGVFTFVIKKN